VQYQYKISNQSPTKTVKNLATAQHNYHVVICLCHTFIGGYAVATYDWLISLLVNLLWERFQKLNI